MFFPVPSQTALHLGLLIHFNESKNGFGKKAAQCHLMGIGPFSLFSPRPCGGEHSFERKYSPFFGEEALSLRGAPSL